jgi:uncharacterized protein
MVAWKDYKTEAKSRGARAYTMRRWMINEGSFSLQVGLSTKNLSLS